MAAGHLVDFQTESLARDATLEVNRKESIAVRYQYPRGHLRPCVERPWLHEHTPTRCALERLVGSGDGRIDVMEEDLGYGIAPPGAHRPVPPENVDDRFLMPGVAPPFARCLARPGDHGRQQDELRDGYSRCDQGSGECSERLGNDDGLGIVW